MLKPTIYVFAQVFTIIAAAAVMEDILNQYDSAVSRKVGNNTTVEKNRNSLCVNINFFFL